MDLPRGLRMMVNNAGQKALAFDPLVYSVDNMGDVIVVTHNATRATELVIPGRVKPGPAKIGIYCSCGKHILTQRGDQ